MSKLFDVIGIDLKTNLVRLVAEKKTRHKAREIERVSVFRHPLKKECFIIVPSGFYRDGDTWGEPR